MARARLPARVALPARVCDLNENRNAVALPANHVSPQRRFLIVAYRDLVAELRIEGRIVGARSVRQPAIDDEVGSDRGGVVPEVVGIGGCSHDHDRRVAAGRLAKPVRARSAVTPRSHVTADGPG